MSIDVGNRASGAFGARGLVCKMVAVAAVLSSVPAMTTAQTASMTASDALPDVVLNAPSGSPTLERNKANVLRFYDLMFNQSKPAEAMQRFGGAVYTQHNPEVPDGRDGFVGFFERMAREHPGKSVAFKRVFADGSYVILHSEHRFPGWRGGRWAAMDIFRLDDQGKIVEHWDVLQKVPSRSANDNGMF
jgi:predicted SnoaL-like aldol condensation-catalyzing enzyme